MPRQPRRSSGTGIRCGRTDVVKWENGYLVVMAKYRHNSEPEEEYIDLKPILDGLYIESDASLKPIKSVCIVYAMPNVKTASKREKNQACLSPSERE